MKYLGANKVLSVLLCMCMLACFIPTAGAISTENPLVTSITIDGIVYTTSVSYLSNGDKMSVVTGPEVIATAILSSQNGTVLITEKTISTGEIKTTIIYPSDYNYSSAVQSHGSSDIVTGIGGDVVSAKADMFCVAYTSYPEGKWSLTVEKTHTKVAYESGNSGLNANNLNGFRTEVNYCVDAENSCTMMVAAGSITILIAAVGGVITGGLGLAAALAGIAVTANFTDAQLQIAVSNGLSHAKNAKIYYDRIV